MNILSRKYFCSDKTMTLDIDYFHVSGKADRQI